MPAYSEINYEYFKEHGRVLILRKSYRTAGYILTLVMRMCNFLLLRPRSPITRKHFMP